jgi:predicted  nucleic acid-binding Zn-ribbon protein
MGVREQIDILVKLQAIDSEIHKINQMLTSVSGRTDQLNAELEEQELLLTEFVAGLEGTQKKYRSLESSLNENIPKIEKSKDRLSTVKTNKEYQSLLKEIEDLTAMNSDFEDQMLECLEQIDLAESRLKENEKAVKMFKAQVDHEIEKIEKEAEKGRGDLEKLQKDWQVIFDTVNPDFMERFDQVRKQVGKYTIARVVQSVCEGCNMNIPPQMYNELQRCEKLMFCPHCQRIIYTDFDIPSLSAAK